MSYIFTPVDDFNRPDSPRLGPDWLDEKDHPSYLQIVDDNAAAGFFIAGAAYIGGTAVGPGMVLADVYLRAGTVVLGAGIGDLYANDGAPYGDPSWAGSVSYIWPGYRASFRPLSVEIIQVGMELVDVGEAYPVAQPTPPVQLAHIDTALPDGPVELALIVNGDEIIAYVNGTVVLTALGTGGLGIGGAGIAFWLQDNASAGGAGGPPPPPLITPVSLNHPLSNRLLDGPRLGTPPVTGVSLNAKLLAGAP